ncbi:MAG: Asp-tRNA(Asn)/Glu-tRNA(Gln) amidotransferase subunit GatA [Opitutales bacterium]|nr:Asp-tRNA(Asn)/Glu-tRNA(Gln) amidotransferase subunit GatA [Opitutales bacterium]
MEIYKTASQLRSALESGEVSSEEWVKQLIQRIESLDGEINSHLGLDKESALGQAKAADQRRANGESLGALDGIPISLKNNMAIKGQKLTCGSHILENFESPYDATVVEKLKAAGAVIFGRLNMDEFAMGSSNETSYFGTTRNPWNLERTPGGSSGGSAAAVAAGFCPVSLGSDTGGSIRQPASFCGVYGLKPTYGRISRYGLVAFASSLDQIGPLAREVDDLADVLTAVSGLDPKDSSSYPETVTGGSSELNGEVKPVIGVPKEFFEYPMDEEVLSSVKAAIAYYEKQGCEVREISLPNSHLSVSAYYVIATAEASSNLARFDGIRYTHRSKDAKDLMEVYFKSRGEGFGEEVKRRIILGTFALSSGYHDAYYLKAQKVRTLIREDFSKNFEDGVDLILTPTAPTTAFKIDESIQDPLTMYLNDIFTIPANLAGLPGLSVPCGASSENLPIGFQLIAPHFKEMSLLQAAKLYENGNEAHLVRPPLGN